MLYSSTKQASEKKKKEIKHRNKKKMLTIYMLQTFTLSAIPITARGKPYVSINADHSDPGKILK